MTSTLTDRIYGESASVALKAPCLAVSTTPLLLSGLGAVGNYVPNPGDRILVVNQADPSTNGIYNASTGAWKRSGDFDGPFDCVQGTLAVVYSPNSAQGLFFQLSTPNPVIGTTPLNFSPFNILVNAFAPQPTNTGMNNGPPSLFGFQAGAPGAPSTNAQPLVSFTQYVSATAGLGAGYVGGGLWSSCYVEGGTGAGKGLTGYVQIDGGVNISAVAVHGFGKINAATSGQLVWSGWFTTHDDAVTVVNQAFGVEIDLVLGVGRPHVTNLIGNNAAVGLWINNQSDVNGPFHGTAAIGISQEGGGAAASQWHTGLFFATNSIVAGGVNEAIQINGGSIAANRYCGMRLLSQFDSGIDMSGAVFTGTGFALILPNGTGSGGVIGAVDSGGAGVGTYNLFYLSSAAPNQLVLGQGAPGGIALNNKVGFGAVAPIAPPAGYGTPTGAAVQGSFAAGAITLPNLAAGFAQLVLDLKRYGQLAA